MLVSSSIANLVNGVSQQPYTLRLASQCELQENGLSTVSEGVKKRPPTKHIKRLINSHSGPAYVHTINRDAVEQYDVIIRNGSLVVFDLAGNQKTVNAPDGWGYLTSSDPKTDFKALTVADYTFIMNRQVAVQESSAVITARPFEGLIAVKIGLYSKTYAVEINGVGVASFSTPDGTVAAHALQISTDYIATQLANQITAAAISGMTVTRYGSVIHLSRTTDFPLKVYDGYSNSALVAIKGKLQRFSDLPINAGQNGFTVEIVGDKSSEFDDYWVKFDTSGNSTGVWRECAKPGIKAGVNTATMPWGLIREADGTFTFRKLSWTDRVAGDDDSAPQPSFVGRTLSDMFFYRNRLGFLSDESLILSEAGKFFNFYPTTVTDLLDGDRIDVAVSHTKVANLLFAVPFAKQLLLFSASTQFSVESGELLTPKTINIKPTTEFECNTVAQPQGIGRNVYFAVPKGDYAGFREYFLDENSNTNDAVDVTSHIPKYIPKDIYKITVALNEDVMIGLSSTTPNKLYIYKFYWANNQKLQSSWSTWVFPSGDEILSAEFVQSKLYLTINRADGVYLEVLDISLGVTAANEPFPVMLDRKRTISASALSYSAPYTIIDPVAFAWAPTDGQYAAVVANDQDITAGVIKDVIWDGTNTKVLGNVTGCDLIVGRKYNFRYKFSTIVPKQKNNNPQGGEKADTLARLQLRNLAVQYAQTGYFKASVTPLGRGTYTYTYSGKTLGLESATIGEINLATGTFQFPVMSRNTTVDIELSSDSPLPVAFLSADWEGFYVKRSQGI